MPNGSTLISLHLVAHPIFSNVKSQNVATMRALTHIKTLEFYDIPQIFVGVDATGTYYLCTLFKQEVDADCYIGVQLSEPRLMAFIGGQLDLREAYTHPEVENAVYRVEVRNKSIAATVLIQPNDISEDMLPEAGFFYDAGNKIDKSAYLGDTYQLEVPAADRITFSTIISRMGWRASSLGKNIGKIAVL